MIPLIISFLSCADGAVALGRIASFLTAEELAEPYTIDQGSKHAVDVDGDFQWETTYGGKNSGSKFEKGAHKSAQDKEKRHSKSVKKDAAPVLPTTNDPEKGDDLDAPPKEEEKPFELKNLKMQVPRGSFVAIVGRVGSGKVCFVMSVSPNTLLLMPNDRAPFCKL